jgi:molecular chaperone GrpE
MGTQEDASGAAQEEPAAPNDGQGDAPDDDPQAKVKELEERVERLTANWQRSQADMSNYRKRVEREQLELVQATTEGLTADTLSILDDFDRAFVTIPENLRSFTWIEGVWLVFKKLEAILNARGLEDIKAEAGQNFDPILHQALSEVDGVTGTVVEVVQKGYTMSSRLIRPALVTVGKGKPATEETPTAQSEVEASEETDAKPDA